MQHQGPVREKDKRESERSELKLLVGKNIARLSQLEGVDLELYSTIVLPRLVEQIVNCKDVIAQQYLLDSIVQAFPDDFHLRTLETLLSACSQLQSGVNIKTILVGLIDRLTSYATSGQAIPSDIQVFTIFSSEIAKVVEQQTTMPVEDILALESSLLNLAITCYPDHLDYVDGVFKFCGSILQEKKEESLKPACVKQIQKLLNSPLEEYKDILTVLKLENYPKLIQSLSWANRNRIAIDVIKTAIQYTPAISQADQVNKLLEFLQPLIKDEEDQPQELDQEDFEEQQNLVASLVHLFQNDDPEQLFAMYITARKHFGQGGPKRIKHTLVPLVFRALKLAVLLKHQEHQDEEWGTKARKVFKFAHETVTALMKINLPETSLRLFLQCAQSAGKCGNDFETIAYEFVTQAFVIYEEQISDSQSQFNAIALIIGTLQNIDIFGDENYDTLITKTALHSSKLLKKPDQCRAICMCSHLWWCQKSENAYKNGKRVLECLQKSLKIADTCMDSSMNVHLFVEILNEYLYYYENQNDAVTVKYLSGLIELINTNIANMDASSSAESINIQYNNTLEFIKWKKTTDTRYHDIQV